MLPDGLAHRRGARARRSTRRARPARRDAARTDGTRSARSGRARDHRHQQRPANRGASRRVSVGDVSPIRGNVDTRLRKLDDGECAALVLAAAGLTRLGLEARISALIPVDVSVPAPGQGIVAIELADAASTDVRAVVSRLNDADASDALVAERAVVAALGGGCQLPLGVLARIDGRAIELTAVVTSLDGGAGRSRVRARRSRATRRAAERLAARLIADGAREFSWPTPRALPRAGPGGHRTTAPYVATRSRIARCCDALSISSARVRAHPI